MELILLILMGAIPFLMGKGYLSLFQKSDKRFYWQDEIIIGGIICIGFAEVVHILGALKGWTLFRCEQLFLALLGVGIVGAVLVLLLKRRKKNNTVVEKQKQTIQYEQFAIFAFFFILVVQLLYLCLFMPVNINGDMTAETVQSFLAEGGIYKVNPMTGNAYDAGIPFRLKILCLPTFYAMLCKMTGLGVDVVVFRFIPMAVLVGFYLVYAVLAKILFRENTLYQYCFLIVVGLLVWIGDYAPGMDGFGLLHAGFRGVSVRGCILVPFLLGLLIRKKWIYALLCVLAEACIVWTLYGLGTCALVTVMWLVLPKIVRKIVTVVNRKEKSVCKNS